jgi:hypothetical protein
VRGEVGRVDGSGVSVVQHETGLGDPLSHEYASNHRTVESTHYA